MAKTVRNPENFYPARYLVEVLNALIRIYPDARLVRNGIGNLAIIDLEEHFIGWIDLKDPEQSHMPVMIDEGMEEV
jgi:hypothetical protein